MDIDRHDGFSPAMRLINLQPQQPEQRGCKRARYEEGDSGMDLDNTYRYTERELPGEAVELRKRKATEIGSLETQRAKRVCQHTNTPEYLKRLQEIAHTLRQRDVQYAYLLLKNFIKSHGEIVVPAVFDPSQGGVDVNTAGKSCLNEALGVAAKSDECAFTLLHIAAIRNDIAMLRFLLRVPGINVNARASWGSTPLYTAIEYGAGIQFIGILAYDNRVDPIMARYRNKRPIDLALELGRNDVIAVINEVYA